MTKSSNIATLVNRIKNDPKDSFSKFALALELLNINRRNEAILLFEDILINDPNYIGVYYHLGEQYFINEENKKAVDTYIKGIEIATSLNNVHAKSELSTALLVVQSHIES